MMMASKNKGVFDAFGVAERSKTGKTPMFLRAGEGWNGQKQRVFQRFWVLPGHGWRGVGGTIEKYLSITGTELDSAIQYPGRVILYIGF